jgi:hypothetical protein
VRYAKLLRRFREVRTESECLIQKAYRLRKDSQIAAQRAQQIQYFLILRIGLMQLAVNTFSLIEATIHMMSYRAGKFAIAVGNWRHVAFRRNRIDTSFLQNRTESICSEG